MGTLSDFFIVSLYIYRKVSNIRRTLVGNKIVDHSDVVGASPVGAAPTTPFAKSNGRFFPDTKINTMPSSNLYEFWWVHKVHAGGTFLRKIY